MSVTWKIALNYLKNNKKRTINLIVCVTIATMLILMVLLIIDTYREYLIQNERNNENWEIKYDDITYEEAKIIEKHSNVKEISIIHLKDKSILNNDDSSNVVLMEYDASAMKNLLQSHLIEGRFPNNNNEILIHKGNGNLQINETARININDTLVDYKVVGILDNSPVIDFLNNNEIITLLDRDSLSDSSNVSITLISNNIKQIYSDYYDIYYMLNSYRNEKGNIEEKTLYNKTLLSYENVLDETSYFQKNILYTESILVGIITIVEMIFIYSVTNIGVTERKKYFGILKSIGATTKQIRKSLKNELNIIICISIPLGLILGILFTYLILQMANIFIPSLENINLDLWSLINANDNINFAIPINIVILSIFLIILVTNIAATIPIRKVERNTSIALIKNTKRKSKVKPTNYNKKINVERKLAYRNLERYKARYSAIISSLTVSILLIISASYYIENTFSKEIEKDYNYVVSLYYNKSENPALVEDIISEIKKSNLANNIKALNQLNVNLLVNKENIHSEEKTASEKMYGKNYEKYGVYMHFFPLYPSTEEFLLYADSYSVDKNTNDNYLKKLGIEKLNDNECILIDYLPEKTKFYNGIKLTNFKEGDEISVDYSVPSNLGALDNNKRKTLKIVKIVKERFINNAGVSLLINSNTNEIIINKGEITEDNNYFINYEIEMNTDNPKELDDLINDLMIKYGLTDENIRGQEYISVELALKVEQMIKKVFIYGFITIITLIGIINIYNAINTSIEVRKREMVRLITIGMEEKQIINVFCLENIICGIISLVLGIAFGILLSYVLYINILDYNLYSFKIPIYSIIISILSIILLILYFKRYMKKHIFSEELVQILRKEEL